MSINTSVGSALDFYSGPNSRGVLRRVLDAVRTYCGAMRSGLTATRAYHALTRQGWTHEEAVRQVFDRHFSVR